MFDMSSALTLLEILTLTNSTTLTTKTNPNPNPNQELLGIKCLTCRQPSLYSILSSSLKVARDEEDRLGFGLGVGVGLKVGLEVGVGLGLEVGA
jgi:hypothetical protein